jgi:hypothetical protein
VLVVVLALALVGLVAKARGEPGDDGRSPDPEHALVSAVAPGAVVVGG